MVARREGVSPSMVSRVIQQLEDALGHQLFYRNTRAILPTESGRLFIEYARSMTEQLSEVRNELQDRKSEPRGLVRINAPVYFGQRHLTPGLPGLLKRHPQLEIELTLSDDFIDPHVEAADVIFRIGALADSSMHARTLAGQTYHLAASQTYLERCGVPEKPADLAEHDCLVYSGESGPNRWLFKGGDGVWQHQPVTPRLSSNNAETLLASALNHMGIVLFPDWLIGEFLKSGRLVNLLNDYGTAIKTTHQYVSVVYPNESPLVH